MFAVVDVSLFCFDILSPSQQLSCHFGTTTCLPDPSWVEQITSIVQGHNTVTLPAVSLKLASIRSTV